MPRAAALPRLTILTPTMDRHTLPLAAQIRMAEGEHQIATLTILTPLPRDQRAVNAKVPDNVLIPEGTPLSFAWGSSLADTSVWYGYVSSRQIQSTKAQTGNAQAPVVPVVYTLTGISMPMQSARGRAYSGITASAAARRVIADYGIAAYVQPHPRIWPALAQGTQSDFAWLAQLAGQIGYRFNVDVDRITFADAGIDLTPAAVTAPIFSKSLQPGIWDSLITFDPASGQTDPSGSTVASVTAYAVRPSSGTAASVSVAPPIIGADGSTSAPTFTKIAFGSAQSYADAAANAQAVAADSRYWVYASAQTDGISALRPGRTVQLGGDGVAAADQGTWRISCVTHALTLSALGRATATYYAYLDLGRDQYSDLDVTAPSPPLGAAGAMSLASGRWITPGEHGGVMTATILRGTVVTAADPLNLERVKVTVPQASGPAALWASPISRGAATMPTAGSAVWVLYESGDPGLPVYVAASAWSAWTPIPPAWVATGWNAYTGAYRLGPAGQVQYQGELNTPSATSSTTISNGSTVLTVPSSLQPALTSSIPVGILPGGLSNTTLAVLRVDGARISIYGGPWTYTAATTTYLSLAALTYAASF